MSAEQQKVNLKTVKRPSVSAVNRTKTRYGEDKKTFKEGGDVMASKMPPWLNKGGVGGGKQMPMVKGKSGPGGAGPVKPPTDKGTMPTGMKKGGATKKMASGGMVSRGWGAARKC